MGEILKMNFLILLLIGLSFLILLLVFKLLKMSTPTERRNFILQFIILAIIGSLITFFITYLIGNQLNPNPEVKKTCYPGKDGINFVLNNPSKIPAEDFNMIIYEDYGGGGKSYADNELCVADIYNFQPKYTLIHCDYIPPNSKAEIGIRFENKTQIKFKYSSWGKTTPKEDYEEGFYEISCK